MHTLISQFTAVLGARLSLHGVRPCKPTAALYWPLVAVTRLLAVRSSARVLAVRGSARFIGRSY